MIALIPARGGSKGLPGKNIRLLNGKPLIGYTIESAIEAKGVSRVIVSTDEKKIAMVAKKFGAEVPFIRPANLATDKANAIDVFRHTITEMEKMENSSIKEFIVLQPTSPFRTSQHVDEAISLFKNKNADSVISYCKEHHPIVWHKQISETGKIISLLKETPKNRQEEMPTYFPNGAIYIFKRDLIEQGIYITENSYAYIMKRKDSIDIDTIEDFEYAEFLIMSHKIK